jgi:hypothetical protein
VDTAPDGRDTSPESNPTAHVPPARDEGADRRSFLRQLSGDAIVTAGKLVGASAVLRRSLVAAGEAAVGHLEEATEARPAPEAASEARASLDEAPATRPPMPETAGQAEVGTMPHAVRPTTTADPIASLTREQHDFLAAGTRAALAVNDPGGHPLIASTIFHWDGSEVRLPARDSTARTADIDRDARVSLLIDKPGTEAWVAIAGLASLVYGEQVEADIRLILAKYHDEAELERRWQEMRSSGDLLAIRVRPVRFVWRGL